MSVARKDVRVQSARGSLHLCVSLSAPLIHSFSNQNGFLLYRIDIKKQFRVPKRFISLFLGLKLKKTDKHRQSSFWKKNDANDAEYEQKEKRKKVKTKVKTKKV